MKANCEDSVLDELAKNEVNEKMKALATTFAANPSDYAEFALQTAAINNSKAQVRQKLKELAESNWKTELIQVEKVTKQFEDQIKAME